MILLAGLIALGLALFAGLPMNGGAEASQRRAVAGLAVVSLSPTRTVLSEAKPAGPRAVLLAPSPIDDPAGEPRSMLSIPERVALTPDASGFPSRVDRLPPSALSALPERPPRSA